MTPAPEDRLRTALRHEVDDVWPAGTFGDVERRRQQLARRSRLTRSALAVVAVVALVGGALALADDGEPDRRVVADPPAEPEPTTTTTPTTTPTTAPPTTTTTVPLPPGAPGIWPFTTAAEAHAGLPAEPPFDTTDPAATAAAFLRTVAGPADAEIGAVTIDGETAEVAITNRIGRPGRVRLARLGGGEHWTVTALESADVTIDEPAPGAGVDEPVRVAGRATAFEGTVSIIVLERVAGAERPRQLAETFATGEQGELLPYATDVALDDVPADGRIIVLAFTTSGEDGSVDRIAAVAATVGPATGA